ncbi:MAG: PD40 domain-containing protein [Flavobacteriales bacterium]|nr:PD40 domain-containing protein [Flavobacteriales bacterium]
MDRTNVLLLGTLLMASVVNAQTLTDRLLYNRLDGNVPSIRLSDGSGIDSLYVDTAVTPQLVMNGRYLLYLSGTLANGGLVSLFNGGQWTRRTIATGDEFILFNSIDFTVGYDLFESDSSSAVAYACTIYNNSFDNTTVLGTMTTDCDDDGPRIRQSDELVVGHNVFQTLFTVNRDGTGRTPIPNTTAFDTWPVWSPDGQWILFSRSNAFYSPSVDRGVNVVNYFKIKQNGDSLTQLTWNAPSDSATFSSNAIWTDNGQSIIAAGELNGRYGLMEIAADGSMYADTLPTAPGGPIHYITGSLPYGLSVGIREERAIAELHVVPNPARDEVMVFDRSNSTAYLLFDAFGRAVDAPMRIEGPDRVRIDVKHLSAGLYVIRSLDGRSMGRVIKE